MPAAGATTAGARLAPAASAVTVEPAARSASTPSTSDCSTALPDAVALVWGESDGVLVETPATAIPQSASSSDEAAWSPCARCAGSALSSKVSRLYEPLPRMWQTVTDSALLLREEARPGAVCSEIAYKVHELQIRNGMQDHIYHRPCHGQGQFFSGHQPPFIALGDDTVLEAGMMFSVEPGLYDPENGFGCNWSDTCLVRKDASVLLSRVPYSEEWSLLKL